MNMVELIKIHEVNYEAEDDFYYISLFISCKYGKMGKTFAGSILYNSKTKSLGLFGYLHREYNKTSDVGKMRFINYLQTRFNIRIDSSNICFIYD